MLRVFMRLKPVTESMLIWRATAFMLLVGNSVFFKQVLAVYSHWEDGLFLLSLFVVVGMLIAFLLSLFCFKRLTRPVLTLAFFTTALSHHFMAGYGVIIDPSMIQNAVETNLSEASDLLTLKLCLHLLFLGVVPSLFVLNQPLVERTWKEEFLSRFKMIGLTLVVIPALLFSQNRYYASFFRAHKPLRYYVNPVQALYSIVKFSSSRVKKQSKTMVVMGLDAEIPETDIHRELIILVVGETVRADHFSLNGYPRRTNPGLAASSVVSFANMTSCGTSTAVSVPCMFSYFGETSFSHDKGHTENILDILQRSGVNILWRDNNSSSKGVALRVPYEDFRTADKNPVCDVECRDIGMLDGLEDFISGQPEGDILIVLHQMGNHGPAYYKRYPPDFRVFEPVCETSQLEDCDDQEIINAYDNAILYTDYFLTRTIQFLQNYNREFEVGMFYVGDHGESLGEKGVYLHGLPKAFAPRDQMHVPALIWLGDGFDYDLENLRKKSRDPFTHDYIFHTLLHLFEVETDLYDQNLDMMR